MGSQLGEFLSPDQVAARFPALSVSYLQKLRSSGKGPHYSKPTRRRVIYATKDVEAWLNASRVASTSEAR